SGSLARRYAKAVLELGNTEKISADLRQLAGAMKTSAELQQALTNPAIRRGDRRKVLDGLLQRIAAHGLTKNLVYLLLDGERLGALPSISRELEKLSGKKVAVTSKQDPDLLGGVVAKVGDRVYDGSLRTQLRNLRDE